MIVLSVLLTAALQMPAPAAPKDAAPAAKQTCRREETTGSIMPGKRICHTAAEWKAIDAANHNAVDAMRDRSGARAGSSIQ